MKRLIKTPIVLHLRFIRKFRKMQEQSKLGFGTRAVHGGQKHDPSTGAVMTPVYFTSTYAQEAPGVHKGYQYSRTGNPTRNALEKNLASIEEGTDALAFGSGLAAVDAVVKLLKSGDHVVSTNDLYGGTYRLFTTVFQQYGIEFTFVPMGNAEDVKAAMRSNTKLVWVETPTNPMLNIIDIKAISSIAKANDALLTVDNTFATPFLQKPLLLGADIVMHSATKYLCGHSDVILGALVLKDQALADRLHGIQNASGAICGPMDSFLVLRGIKTLHLRMQQHCKSAEVVAHFLLEHPAVENVYWPGLENHPNHEIAKKQMSGFGGMVSFSLKGNEKADAVKIVSGMNVFTLAESLGGVESLSGHPATMTHWSIPKEEREKNGIVDSLIRLSVGIEDIDDLTADLKQALDKLAL
jgi:cystathionine gamma-lyase